MKTYLGIGSGALVIVGVCLTATLGAGSPREPAAVILAAASSSAEHSDARTLPQFLELFAARQSLLGSIDLVYEEVDLGEQPTWSDHARFEYSRQAELWRVRQTQTSGPSDFVLSSDWCFAWRGDELLAWEPQEGTAQLFRTAAGREHYAPKLPLDAPTAGLLQLPTSPGLNAFGSLPDLLAMGSVAELDTIPEVLPTGVAQRLDVKTEAGDVRATAWLDCSTGLVVRIAWSGWEWRVGEIEVHSGIAFPTKIRRASDDVWAALDQGQSMLVPAQLIEGRIVQVSIPAVVDPPASELAELSTLLPAGTTLVEFAVGTSDGVLSVVSNDGGVDWALALADMNRAVPSK
jgi:hypothetical protein